VDVAPWPYATGTITIDGVSFRIEGHGSVEKTRFAIPLGTFTGTLTTPDGAVRPLNLSGIYEYAVVR
jgi:hypothetical protein